MPHENSGNAFDLYKMLQTFHDLKDEGSIQWGEHKVKSSWIERNLSTHQGFFLGGLGSLHLVKILPIPSPSHPHLSPFLDQGFLPAKVRPRKFEKFK